jgi:valyl-tRNA synthetase
VLTQVRKAKSEAQVSMRAPVTRLVVGDTTTVLAQLRAGLTDLQQAAKAGDVLLTEADHPSVTVTLAVD